MQAFKLGEPLNRELLINARDLSTQRDKLAAKICADLNKYKLGLDFYNIGTSKEHEPPEVQEWAAQRLKRLETQANNANKTLITTALLQKYLNAQDQELRCTMAQEIINDKSRFYPAVFQLKNAPQVLKRLHQDAKLHAQITLTNSLDIEEQAAFGKIEKYLQAKKDLAKIWYERKTSTDSDHQVLQDITKTAEVLRDQLAADIVDNHYHSLEAIEFFKLDFEKLNIEATRHHIRNYCIQFKKLSGNLKDRLELARKIISYDKKAYAIVKYDINLDWNKLLKYSEYLSKSERTANMSDTQKQAYNTVVQYKRLRKESGQLWSEVFAKQAAEQDVTELSTKAKIINHERNKLAAIINKDLKLHEEFLQSERVPTKDLAKHTQAYEHQEQRQQQKPAHKIYWDLDTVNKALADQAAKFVT